MLSADGRRRVMEAAKANDVLVISDEVYHTCSYIGDYASALPLDSSLDNLVVINSFSKTLAIMGWRLGFVIAHPRLIRQMDVYKETVTACSPSIAQWAVAEYLDDSADYQRWVGSTCSPISRGWRRIPQPWPSVCFRVGWPWLWAGRSGRMARAAPACLSLRTGTILTRLSVASRGR